MFKRVVWLCLCLNSGRVANAQSTVVEHGVYTVHLLLHAIGTEDYTLTRAGSALELDTRTATSDRGTARALHSNLVMSRRFEPIRAEQESVPARAEGGSLTQITGTQVTVREGATGRTFPLPDQAFAGFAQMPASAQMMMMRYWLAHGRPAHLPILRASEKALPLEIRMVGHDAFSERSGMVRLTRYTVQNLVFGREVLWMDAKDRLAAVMTFAGGLPQEVILDQYLPQMGQLVHSGVRQEMLDLGDLDQQVKPLAEGTYALTGAHLIDGTGAPPVEDATVIVQNGRIASVGKNPPPPGMRVVPVNGKTLLPGLWEMHAHFSGVEFGPALLAAGVTTVRDCGGEFDFLTSVRHAIEQEHALGPRLLLAGLIDSGGPLAFGNVDVKTAAEASAAVDMYADQHFEQIKVYNQLTPEMLKAISGEAHARGMTVTGHVPVSVTTIGGIEDGMDQINHLQYVTRAMAPEGGGPVDVNSPRAKDLIAILKALHIVVDPTAGWSEMAGHPGNVDVASFEPGIEAAPYTLAAKFQALGSPAADEAKFRQRMQTNLEVIHALYVAGVSIVAGSDTGLLGYGLDRELELYVQAGMTPMAAIQSATIVAARAMKHDRDSGTIEAGKRADLMLIDGDPLEKIANLRNVVSVIKEGRMYDSKALGRSVGFNR